MSANVAKLTQEIANAARKAVESLMSEYSDIYYCSLITTGEAHSPFLAAWSEAELKKEAERQGVDALELKWSYADSPLCFYSESLFESLRSVYTECSSGLSNNECLEAMEAAMKQLDAEGLFGRGEQRDRVYVNVEVMPPDHSNTERAKRLNPQGALSEWLVEAAE